MVDYLDADLANADWTKQSWDLGPDTEPWETAPIADIQAFVELPAYAAAPPDIREVIERRLFAVAD